MVIALLILLLYFAFGAFVAYCGRMENDRRLTAGEVALVCLFWPYVVYEIARRARSIKYKGRVIWERKK